MTRAAMPFLLVNVFVLLLVTYVPAISTWVPSLFFEGVR
jgi:TRAP-type C4-dicarboxylate transport system permease large subunit